MSIAVDLGPTDNVMSSLCSVSLFFTSQNSGSYCVDLYLYDMYLSELNLQIALLSPQTRNT